ncbi:NAD(P)-dependent oxidoreductase [Acuticoccus sediminis]|uniref:NAD(P)-dependent oxidoreductase n=1 Tax=Acuticoccus sediminis TaxID=2184697 RepID=A0A8B2NFM5_9HYPH|nr:NAD(P)-dependent oxidoreductase [Acuticoccus sediminis]RAH96375.1 NAD(P)-dependent oxidoreductase [Acuticoccus sediminis]
MRVGIAGFGKMGAAMAERLTQTGVELRIWNRDLDRVRTAGFATADTPSRLAADCDLVISSLFDPPAIRAVYEGNYGLLASGAGVLFVEMSTARPDDQRALAVRARESAAAFIECPVSGTTGPARTGQLLGFAGGETGDVERARPILEHLCRRVDHVGPVGAGALFKLAVNLPLLAFWKALGEAMVLLKDLDAPPERILEIFSQTAGAPPVLKVKMDAIAATFAGDGSIETSFAVNAMRKDLGLILAEAHDRGLSLPLAATVFAGFDAMEQAGWGDRDCAWTPAWWVSKS